MVYGKKRPSYRENLGEKTDVFIPKIRRRDVETNLHVIYASYSASSNCAWQEVMVNVTSIPLPEPSLEKELRFSV
jgi:hypothetical protein